MFSTCSFPSMGRGMGTGVQLQLLDQEDIPTIDLDAENAAAEQAAEQQSAVTTSDEPACAGPDCPAPLPAFGFVEGTLPEDIWKDEEQRKEVIWQAEPFTKWGVAEAGVAPTAYAVDLLDKDDPQVERLLAAMNAPRSNTDSVASWNAPYESTGSEANRHFAKWPVQLVHLHSEKQLRRVNIEFRFPAESLTEDEIAWYVRDRKVDASQQLDHPRRLYLSLDHKAIESQLAGVGMFGAGYERLAHHVTPISARVLSAQNDTSVSMRSWLETASFATPGVAAFRPMTSPVGLCTASGGDGDDDDCNSERFSMAVTLPSRHASAPLQPAELSTLYRLSPKRHFFSPEAARWSTVDLQKEKENARAFRYKNGESMHFPVATLSATQPATLAEFVVVSHGKELVDAHHRVEALRLRGGPSASGVPIRPPHLTNIKQNDTTTQVWVVNTAAFELALDYLCGLYAPSTFGLNLAAPLRLALEPRDGGDMGFRTLKLGGQRDMREKHSRTVGLSAVVELTFLINHHATGQQLSSEQVAQHITPLRTHCFRENVNVRLFARDQMHKVEAAFAQDRLMYPHPATGTGGKMSSNGSRDRGDPRSHPFNPFKLTPCKPKY